MIKREKLLNYFLSIGFVLFLTIFLSLIVVMSRFVLSGVTPIGAHVQNTQSLLEDIEQVQKAASLNMENRSQALIIGGKREKYSSFNELGVDISQVNYFNSIEGNSVLSITFNGEVGEEDGVFYLTILPDNLIKGDFVAFKVNGILKTGEFLVLDPNTNNLHISTDDELVKINKKQLLGKVFYIESNEED